VSSEAIKEVLITNAYSCFEKSRLTKERAKTLLGNGLLALDDSEHKVHKAKLLPAFAPRRIRPLYDVFWSKACELAGVLEDAIPNGPVTLRAYTSRAALDIIGVAAWGKDFSALKHPTGDVVSKYSYIHQGSPAAKRQAQMIYVAATVVSMKTLTRWFPKAQFFVDMRAGIVAIRGACAGAIREKRMEKEKEMMGNDILSVAVGSGEFDDEALTGHMLNVLAAGHETSSLNATWACYLLSRHPDIQTRLRKEIREKLPSPKNKGSDVDMSHALEQLPLLRAVIKESLRVIPPVPLLRREAAKDTTILGHHVPKGTDITTMAWVVHKSVSEWGDDALEFKPDRWLQPGQEALGGARSSHSNLSFSAGPRSCIGEGFAKAEALAMMAVLVGRFEFELVEDFDREVEDLPDLLWGITVKSMAMRFRMRVVEGW